MDVNEVSHWTVYGVIEGAQTIEVAYRESVAYVALEPDETVPTLEEVKEAMRAELQELQQLTEPTVADVDQSFFLQIALGTKTLDDLEKYYDDLMFDV